MQLTNQLAPYASAPSPNRRSTSNGTHPNYQKNATSTTATTSAYPKHSPTKTAKPSGLRAMMRGVTSKQSTTPTIFINRYVYPVNITIKKPTYTTTVIGITIPDLVVTSIRIRSDLRAASQT